MNLNTPKNVEKVPSPSGYLYANKISNEPTDIIKSLEENTTAKADITTESPVSPIPTPKLLDSNDDEESSEQLPTPEETSSSFEIEQLDEYDSIRRQFLIIFWITVVIAVFILVLTLTSTGAINTDIKNNLPNNNNKSNITKNASATEVMVPGSFYTIHIICMIISIGILSSFSIVIFRLLPEVPFWILRWIHLFLQVVVLIIFVFASVQVIYTIFDPNRSKFGSLHEWCGIFIFLLYIIECISGIGFFIGKNTIQSSGIRTTSQKFHSGLGLILQFLISISIATGVTEFNIRDEFTWRNWKWSSIPKRNFLAKGTGFLSVPFFILFFVLMLADRFTRKARPKWKCLYKNPHNTKSTLDESVESSKTLISKESWMKLGRHRRNEVPPHHAHNENNVVLFNT